MQLCNHISGEKMKKIVCILACLITYNLSADSLLQAIRARDVQAVTNLLENKNFTVDYYDMYVTALEESLWMAREQMLLQRVLPTTDDTYNSLYVCTLLASAGGFAWAAVNSQNNWALFFMSLPFLALPLAIKGTHTINRQLQQQYNDAVQIQDLVFTTFADLT
jgi:hypothetical protein